MSKYWEKYYKVNKSPIQPTKFATFCTKFLKNFSGNIYDLGCGNGRDTNFFNKLNLNCYGVDLCKVITKKNKKRFKSFGEKFIQGDFSKLNFIEKKKDAAIFSRFSLHSITKKKQQILFQKLRKLKNVKLLMIEVRTIYDELFGKGTKISKYEYVHTHYRRFLIPKEIKKDIMKNYNLKYFKVSRNFAKYNKENPKVLRIIAIKK